MAKKKVTKVTDGAASSTVDDAWVDEERAIDELVALTKCLRATVEAVGATRKRAKFRASEAAAKMREAVAEALGEESRAFADWARLADQPALFSEDEMSGRRPAAAPRAS